MVIVYRSNTGFTKEYAEMLGKAEKMKVCPLAEAQGKVGPGSPSSSWAPSWRATSPELTRQ